MVLACQHFLFRACNQSGIDFSSTMKKINPKIGIVIALLALVFMISAIKNNPTDAAPKLHIMRDDMEEVLKNGGVVVMNSYNSKYGSAYLYVGIDAKTWTPDLAKKYSESLSDLGWKRSNFDGNVSFCKYGINAEVQRNVEYGESKAVYGINMTYNALTIRRCSEQ